MIRELKTKAEGEFTDYSGAVLVQDDVQCYRIVLDCNQQLDGASFQVTAKRADGEVIQDIGTISGSRAEYVVANNMYAVMGEVIFRLTLLGSDGSVLTAKELVCNVVEANGEADLDSDDRVPALSTLIVQASQAAGAANEAASAANEAADAANEAAQAASSVSSQIGDLDDLATNTKTNLVGAINELADYDEFTVTEDDYSFTTSKRNVIINGSSDNPEYNSCEVKGTSQGQFITVHNPMFGSGTKDIILLNAYGQVSTGVEITVAKGESRTFLYANGFLWADSEVAAQSIDYGNDNNFTRMSKPAKRYFVQVPSGNTSTSTLQISNLELTRDKKYYIHAVAASEVSETIRLEPFDGLSGILGCVFKDGVMSDIFQAGNFGSFTADQSNGICVWITGVLEPDYMLGYIKGEIDVTYGDMSGASIHHLKISGLFDTTSFIRLAIYDENCYFMEGSFLEITTV